MAPRLQLATLDDLIEQFRMPKSSTEKVIRTPGFPQPIYLSPRCPRWIQGEVDQWILRQQEQRKPTGVVV